MLSVEPNLKAEFNIFNFYRLSDDTAKFVTDLTVGSIMDAGFEVDLGMVTMPTKVIDGEPINITHVRERWSGGQSYYEQGKSIYFRSKLFPLVGVTSSDNGYMAGVVKRGFISYIV